MTAALRRPAFYSQDATERTATLSRTIAPAKLGSWNAVCGQQGARRVAVVELERQHVVDLMIEKDHHR